MCSQCCSLPAACVFLLLLLSALPLSSLLSSLLFFSASSRSDYCLFLTPVCYLFPFFDSFSRHNWLLFHLFLLAYLFLLSLRLSSVSSIFSSCSFFFWRPLISSLCFALSARRRFLSIDSSGLFLPSFCRSHTPPAAIISTVVRASRAFRSLSTSSSCYYYCWLF